jgi:SnoaL-like domain
MKTESLLTSAKQVTLNFINALNDEDFKTAREYVSEDMTFAGVMGTRNGAEAYFKDMEHMKLKYDIKKIFEDEDDVCLFYNITMSGIKIFSCGWYHIINGKINSFKVIFDPRPLLEQREGKL